MARAIQASRPVLAKPHITVLTAAAAAAVSDLRSSCEGVLPCSSSARRDLGRGGRVHGKCLVGGGSSFLSGVAETTGGLPLTADDHCRDAWRKLVPASQSSLRRNRVTMSAAGGTSRLTFGPPAAKTIILHPSVKHTATIVWLHGLGDTGTGWSNLLEILALPHIKWVIPTAPVQPVTINGGYPSTAWFDIRGLTADAPEDIVGIEQSAKYILDLLRSEKEAGGEDLTVAIGGLSQGGALSLYLATRLAVGSWSDGSPVSPLSLSGAVCLSGWLPQGRMLGVAPPNVAAKAANIPVLMCHGDADPLIPSLFGELSHQALQLFGFSNSQFKRYKGLGHEVGGEEMSDLRDWLLANFPPPN